MLFKKEVASRFQTQLPETVRDFADLCRNRRNRRHRQRPPPLPVRQQSRSGRIKWHGASKRCDSSTGPFALRVCNSALAGRQLFFPLIAAKPSSDPCRRSVMTDSRLCHIGQNKGWRCEELPDCRPSSGEWLAGNEAIRGPRSCGLRSLFHRGLNLNTN